MTRESRHDVGHEFWGTSSAETSQGPAIVDRPEMRASEVWRCDQSAIASRSPAAFSASSLAYWFNSSTQHVCKASALSTLSQKLRTSVLEVMTHDFSVMSVVVAVVVVAAASCCESS